MPGEGRSIEEMQRTRRIVLHIDLDAYYASIEQRDHPELRGKPVVVGGPREGRGVVATCSARGRGQNAREERSARQDSLPALPAGHLSPATLRGLSRGFFPDHGDLQEYHLPRGTA